MLDSDVREYVRATKKEARKIKRAERARDRRYAERCERSKSHRERGAVFRTARFIVNNFGPNGLSEGGKDW